MASQEELKVVISGDSTGAESALQRVGQFAVGIGLEKLFSDITNSAKEFITSSFELFEKTQISYQQLDAVLKSTGRSAFITKDEIDRLSSSLSANTEYSKGTVRQMEIQLLQYEHLGKDILPSASQAILDFSARMGRDPVEAARSLGMALEAPFEGLNRLRGLGVKVTEDQKTLMDSFKATGDSAHAQSLIIDLLNKQYGGAAAANIDASGLAMKRFGEAVNGAKMIMGQMISEAITPLFTELSKKEYVDNFLASFKGIKDIGKDVSISFDNMTKSILGLIKATEGKGDMFKDMSKGFATFFKGLAEIADMVSILIGAFDIIGHAIGFLFGVMTKNEKVIQQQGKQWDDAAQNIQKSWAHLNTMAQKDAAEITNKWKTESDAATTAVVGNYTMMNTNTGFEMAKMKEAHVTASNDIKTTVIANSTTTKDGVTTDYKTMSSELSTHIDTAKTKNAELVTSFQDVDSKMKPLHISLKTMFNDIFKWAGDALSKASDAIGKFGNAIIGKKASGGFASGMTLVGETGPELVNLPGGSFVNQAASSRGMSGGSTSITINNPSIRNDNDITMLVRQIKKALGRENELVRLGAL